MLAAGGFLRSVYGSLVRRARAGDQEVAGEEKDIVYARQLLLGGSGQGKVTLKKPTSNKYIVELALGIWEQKGSILRPLFFSIWWRLWRH